MKSIRWAGLATGCLLFVGQLSAAEKSQAPRIADVALAGGGLLVGTVVDAGGKPQSGAEVSLKQGNREIARVTSDSAGRFGVKRVRGGVYELQSANHRELFRVWAPGTAPPRANSTAVLVAEERIVRGQGFLPVLSGLDVITVGTLGGVAATTGFSIANYQENKDIKDMLENMPPAASN